ncbi:MAG: FtsX-like permease family protein, partial [Bacillota bacterium]|nr:FtsX-like permease family protein [Bacillota bacterium]
MLLLKALRDMKANITQFISIFLMAVLGVFAYSGINAEWYGMKNIVDKYYEETRMPYLWVLSTNFSIDDAAAVKKLKGISAVSRRCTFDAIADTENKASLRINIVEDNVLSKPKTVEGEAFDLTKDGLWLDASFARANKLKPGQELAFKFQDIEIRKKILGLILNPEYLYSVKDDSSTMPNPETFGFAFLPSAALPQGIEIPFNRLLIDKTSSGDEKAVTSELETIFKDRYNVILNRDTQLSAATFKNEIEQNKAMGGVFPIVFFLIAALTMLTTMTRMTTNQRTQIGILKAMGFSRRKILMHYMSYGLWIGLLGGLVGLFTGPLVIPPILFSLQKTMYYLPEWSAKISPSSVLVVVLAVFCCGVSSYFACRKALKEVPAAALRPVVPKAGRHSNFEKSRLWHRMGFSVQWNLRDVMRSKVRSVIAVIGVMGCTALLLFGLGLKDSVNFISNWMYKDLNVYESKVNLKEGAAAASVEALKNAYNGQLISEANIQIRNFDKQESGSLTVLDKGEEIKFQDAGRNSITLPDKDIGLSYKMAEILKLKAGDKVEWRIYGEKDWHKSEIRTIYRTPMSQGIVMSKEEYQKMGYEFKPTALLTPLKADGAERFEAVKEVQDKKELMNSFNK